MSTDTRTIPLTQGQVALVDAADYDWLMQWRWYAVRCKHTFYAGRNEPRGNGVRHSIRMHCVILGATDAEFVDHSNHDGLDNRRSNIRIATPKDNASNRTAKLGKGSKFLGVCWHKGCGKWQVRISVGNKGTHIGMFACEVEAAKAYDAAARAHHGEFANLNFPVHAV